MDWTPMMMMMTKAAQHTNCMTTDTTMQADAAHMQTIEQMMARRRCDEERNMPNISTTTM